MVKSLPSIEEQDYQAMINELYAISSELLMDTGSHTKVSIENVQHNQLRNMQNLVSQIETTWKYGAGSDYGICEDAGSPD